MPKQKHLQQRLEYVKLAWSDEDMQAIIEKRLQHFSNDKSRPYKRLAELSQIDNLDERVIREAKGNPRTLIMLCNYLIEEHCQVPVTEDNLQLTRSDLNRALRKLVVRMDTQETVQESALSESILPTPIAVTFARYRNEQNPPDKLRNAFHLTLVVLQYTSCTLLALYKHCNNRDGNLDAKLRELVFDPQRPPSMGDWSQVINRISNVKDLINNDLVNSIAEFRSHKKLGKSLEFIIRLRNDFYHERLGIPDDGLFTEINDHIEIMLNAFQSLWGLELLSIEGVEISSEEQVVHNVELHRGNILIPEKTKRKFDKNYLPGRIVLSGSESSLNAALKPFVVFEKSSESIGARHKDIYFFERMVDSQSNGHLQVQYINPINKQTIRLDSYMEELRFHAFV